MSRASVVDEGKRKEQLEALQRAAQALAQAAAETLDTSGRAAIGGAQLDLQYAVVLLDLVQDFQDWVIK